MKIEPTTKKHIYFCNSTLIQLIFMFLAWYFIGIIIDKYILEAVKNPDVGLINSSAGGSWDVFDITSGLPGSSVQRVAICDDESFIAVLDKGWIHFKNDDIKKLPDLSGHMPSDVVCADNRAYFTSGNVRKQAVGKIVGNRIEVLEDDAFATSLLVTSNNELWYGKRFSDEITNVKTNDVFKLGKAFGLETWGIIEMPDGTLLAFGEDGYSIFRNGLWDTVNVDENYPLVRTPAQVNISVLDRNSVWINLWNGSVYIYHDGVFKQYDSIYTAIDANIEQIQEKTGTINMGSWIRFEDGLIIAGVKKRKKNRWSRISAISHLNNTNIVKIFLSGDNDIYFFTNKGIYRCNNADLGS